MTSATFERIKHDIESARGKGDLVAVARLRAQIPLNERNEWDATHGRHIVTSAGRGYRTPGPTVTGGGSAQTVTKSDTRSDSYAPIVVIEESAWRQLDGDHFDGRERGGYLFSPVDEPDVITHAIVADLDDTRTGTSVQLDRETGHDFWQSLPLDLTIRGSWHVHPKGTHAQPSSVDLSSARGAAAAYGRPWIEIVVHDAPTYVIGMHGRSQETSRLEVTATIVRADGSYVPAQIERSY